MAEQAETVSGATNSTRPDSSYAGDGNAAPARAGAAELPTLEGRTMADLGAQVAALRGQVQSAEAAVESLSFLLASQRSKTAEACKEIAAKDARIAELRRVIADAIDRAAELAKLADTRRNLTHSERDRADEAERRVEFLEGLLRAGRKQLDVHEDDNVRLRAALEGVREVVALETAVAWPRIVQAIVLDVLDAALKGPDHA